MSNVGGRVLIHTPCPTHTTGTHSHRAMFAVKIQCEIAAIAIIWWCIAISPALYIATLAITAALTAAYAAANHNIYIYNTQHATKCTPQSRRPQGRRTT